MNKEAYKIRCQIWNTLEAKSVTDWIKRGDSKKNCKDVNGSFTQLMGGNPSIMYIFVKSSCCTLWISYIFVCQLYFSRGWWALNPGDSVKNPPGMQVDQSLTSGSVRSSGEGNGNPLQYSCLEIPWTEEPGLGLQSMGSQKSWTRLSD